LYASYLNLDNRLHLQLALCVLFSFPLGDPGLQGASACSSSSSALICDFLDLGLRDELRLYLLSNANRLSEAVVPEDKMASAKLSVSLACLDRHCKIARPPNFISSNEPHTIGKRKRDESENRVGRLSSPLVPNVSGSDVFGARIPVVETNDRWKDTVDRILTGLFHPDKRPTKQQSIETIMLDTIASLPALSHDEIRGLGLLACAGSHMLVVDGDDLACARCDADAIFELDHGPRALDHTPLEAMRSAFARALYSVPDPRKKVTLLQTARRILIHSKVTFDCVPNGMSQDAIGRVLQSHLEAKERMVRLAAG
jgi:hypothetical protein